MAETDTRLEELAKEQDFEREAAELYITKTYSFRVPEPLPPTKEDLSFWKIAGIDATLLAIAAIGAVLFSSLRTGQMFYIIETLLLQQFSLSPIVINVFSFTAMLTSLLAFEGYLAGVGFYKGRHLQNVKISNLGILLTLSVIIVAGIFSGFGLITLAGDWDIIFKTSIAVLTAFAAGFIVYLSGENMGYAFSQVDVAREEMKRKHMEEYQNWREHAIKSFNTSKMRSGRKAIEQPVQMDVQKSVQNEQNESKVEQGYHEIEQYLLNNKKLPTVRDLSNILGISVGTAYNALKEYKERNSIE
jgi:hypothetical protein